MNPKEYIVNWFQTNQKRLSLKNVQYAYHNYSDTHFVYCDPPAESLNFDSRMLLNDFIISFEKIFNNEQIGLLDSNSLTKLENPEAIIQKS
jgi:hypothetical protein